MYLLADNKQDNKTLVALSAGRLPSRDDDEDDPIENLQPLSLKPSSFEMFVSTSENEFHSPTRIHDYSSLSSPPFNGSRQSINMVRDKFPELQYLESTNSLPPCIIHLNVGISLMKERPDGAELHTRVSIWINLIISFS